ncbi:hypothetical protein CJT66_35170, partial [Pseudomonas aeruginosa]
APPDILNQSGQDWGVSAFNPEGLRRHGYRAFREMLRANLAWPQGVCRSSRKNAAAYWAR